jgi:zinc protease
MSLTPIRRTLDNGTTLLVKETRMTPAVTISLAMKAGSAADPPGMAGTVWLLSRMIDRGTSVRSAQEVAEAFESRGVSLAVNVTRHLFTVICTCLAEDFEPVLALLGEMLMSPSLPDEELATLRGEVITAIRQDQDNPAVRATETLMAALYPNGHPYGRPTKGSVDVVERLTRADLAALHAERFAPSELTAVIVGDVDEGKVSAAADRVFGAWRKARPSPIVPGAVPPSTERRRILIPMMNKSQAEIAYGFVTIARNDPDYYACWLMNNAFGQYSIGGRLGDSIRERQGMAYHVSSSLDANVVAGPLAIRAGVGAANIDRAVASIDEEIARLLRDGLTPKELDESRRYLVGSIPRALETNPAITNFLQVEEFFGLGLDYDARLPDLLGAVTLDDANAAGRRLLDPARATFVIAGPYQ